LTEPESGEILEQEALYDFECDEEKRCPSYLIRKSVGVVVGSPRI
jgi:hypothetical protein